MISGGKLPVNCIIEPASTLRLISLWKALRVKLFVDFTFANSAPFPLTIRFGLLNDEAFVALSRIVLPDIGKRSVIDFPDKRL